MFCFDVRDRDACKKCVDSLENPVDILLNNAGLASGLKTLSTRPILKIGTG
jgi:NADP-dependent 3-hydroxy acid dehydrogenase YdfG